MIIDLLNFKVKRSILIVGNWKMHKTAGEAQIFIDLLKAEIQERGAFLAVPFTAIGTSVAGSQGSSIVIGAQNMHDAQEGAFTGEISAPMLKASGAAFVILGHSERRHYFGEDNAFIRRKLMSALKHGLMPILCIGEQSADRDGGHYEEVLRRQLEETLFDLYPNKLAIAYEPVWAIGTGKAATPEIAQETHLFIRHCLTHLCGKEIATQIPLLYGGSVNLKNIATFLSKPDINGVLIGGASLDPQTFAQIIRENS